MACQSLSSDQVRIIRPNESEMGAVDGEKPLDDGLGDLVWPEAPAATPAADKDEEGEYEEAGQKRPRSYQTHLHPQPPKEPDTG